MIELFIDKFVVTEYIYKAILLELAKWSIHSQESGYLTTLL